MLKVFIGMDHRQLISANVLQQSIWRHSSQPVSITQLVINKPPYENDLVKDQLPIHRQGLTPFTYSRFMVPYLCDYQGWALFMDSDMLMRGDLAELFSLATPEYSVMVVRNPNPDLKYELASMMLFNCEKCKILTPEYIDSTKDPLHLLAWAAPEEVGVLPTEWNHLVGYDKPRDDAKLIHYTQGNPCFPETIDCEHSVIWHNEHALMNSRASWVELMGNSKHALRFQHADGSIEIVPRYKIEMP